MTSSEKRQIYDQGFIVTLHSSEVLFYILRKWKTSGRHTLKFKMAKSILNPSSLMSTVEIKRKADCKKEWQSSWLNDSCGKGGNSKGMARGEE